MIYAEPFTTITGIIGIGLLPIAFVIYSTFKTPISNYVDKSSKKLFESDKFKQIVNIKSLDQFDLELIRTFYDDVDKIFDVRGDFRRSVLYCIMCGALLTLTSLLNLIDNASVVVIPLLLYGIFFFLLFLYYLFRVLRYIAF